MSKKSKEFLSDKTVTEHSDSDKLSKIKKTKDDKDKKNTSLRLDKETLKALKIRAIEENTSIQKLLESLIESYLKQGKPHH